MKHHCTCNRYRKTMGEHLKPLTPPPITSLFQEGAEKNEGLSIK